MKKHKFQSSSQGGKAKTCSRCCLICAHIHFFWLKQMHPEHPHPHFFWKHGAIYIIQWGFFTIFANQRLNHCYNPLKRNIRLVSLSLLGFSWIRKENWWPFNLDTAERTSIKLKVWLDNCMKAWGLPIQIKRCVWRQKVLS